MPAAYTPSQKASIAQFVGFTQAKDSAAAKVGALHTPTGFLLRCHSIAIEVGPTPLRIPDRFWQERQTDYFLSAS